MLIDTTFDFRTDARGGDPDQTSPTLRRYHQLLWSKPVPSGHRFDLHTTTPGEYLHHNSDLGEFWLGSDAVMAAFHNWASTASLIAQIPPADERFETIGYTIGGMMVFPNNMIDKTVTLNAARGMNRLRIADRMDLTLEFIRRYYRGDTLTPLGPIVARYHEFFGLFGDFKEYTSTSFSCKTSSPLTTRQ